MAQGLDVLQLSMRWRNYLHLLSATDIIRPLYQDQLKLQMRFLSDMKILRKSCSICRKTFYLHACGSDLLIWLREFDDLSQIVQANTAQSNNLSGLQWVGSGIVVASTTTSGT